MKRVKRNQVLKINRRKRKMAMSLLIVIPMTLLLIVKAITKKMKERPVKRR
jgi:hypothetical protein